MPVILNPWETAERISAEILDILKVESSLMAAENRLSDLEILQLFVGLIFALKAFQHKTSPPPSIAKLYHSADDVIRDVAEEIMRGRS